MASHPSRTRLHGELADGRAALAERIRTFEDPEEADRSSVQEDQSGVQHNTLRKVIPVAGLAAGVAAVIAAGGFIDSVSGSIARGVNELLGNADTYGMLQQPYPEVNAEVRSGAINPSDVVRVTVPAAATAWGEAKALAGPDHAAGPVSTIISAQQGNALQRGDHLLLQAGSIDSPPQPGPQN